MIHTYYINVISYFKLFNPSIKLILKAENKKEALIRFNNYISIVFGKEFRVKEYSIHRLDKLDIIDFSFD